MIGKCWVVFLLALDRYLKVRDPLTEGKIRNCFLFKLYLLAFHLLAGVVFV